jgi:23S rRNA (adenine2030-N6)-methyltransferase
MNYRHIYHAGNFADVVKHTVLMMVLDYMKQKDKPFFVLDTHGGIGLYDLEREEARKTAEADDGIVRLRGAPGLPAALAAYVAMADACNRKGSARYYPGSPLIAQKMLRPGDALVVNELHPEDVEALARVMGGDGRVRIEHRDGYECLRALLPPPQRRGVVLVDPPFEVRDEFKIMVRGLKEAHERFAGGTYILWYPIKDPAHVAAFHADLAALGIPDILAVDFYRRKPDDTDTLNGAGLIIANPPWTLRRTLEDEVLPVLVERLTDGRGFFTVKTVAAE